MKEEGRSGLSVIKPASFYSNESEKTKLNWFCYELSVGIYDDMKEDIGKLLKKHKIRDENLVVFSIYISKKMKDIILQNYQVDSIMYTFRMK